jgi:hypothetical protein
MWWWMGWQREGWNDWTYAAPTSLCIVVIFRTVHTFYPRFTRLQYFLKERFTLDETTLELHSTVLPAIIFGYVFCRYTTPKNVERGRRQLGGGEAMVAARQRNVGCSLAAALRWRQRQRRWRRRTAQRWQRGGSSAVAAAVAAARQRDVAWRRCGGGGSVSGGGGSATGQRRRQLGGGAVAAARQWRDGGRRWTG